MVFFVRVIFHPPGNPDPDYDEADFRKDEEDMALQEYVNKPVFVEHCPEISVGIVESTFRTRSGHLVCDMAIDDSTPKGKLVREQVENGTLRGASTGFTALSTGEIKVREGGRKRGWRNDELTLDQV